MTTPDPEADPEAPSDPSQASYGSHASPGLPPSRVGSEAEADLTWLPEERVGDPRRRGEAVGMAAVVTAATAGGLWLAMAPLRAGTFESLFILGVIYVGLAGLAALRLRRRGLLQERLAPRRGDLTLGALLAAVGWGVARGGQLLLAAPDSHQEGWIIRLYVQIGEPAMSATFEAGFALLLVASLEEVAWRGGVQEALIDGFGPRRGWLAAAVLYALAHAPTAWRLAVTGLGPNPLLLVAALAGGLVWGFLAMKSGRVAPSIAAHAFFTWAVVQFPLWSL